MTNKYKIESFTVSKKVELIQVTKQMSLEQIKTNLKKALNRQGIKITSTQTAIVTSSASELEDDRNIKD